MSDKRLVQLAAMNDVHWSFRSTDSDFDGSRIVREAENKGVQLLQITRRDSTRTHATHEYIRRLEYVGLQIKSCPCAFYLAPHPTRSFALGDESISTKWRLIKADLPPEELHAELKKREFESPRTVVRGWL